MAQIRHQHSRQSALDFWKPIEALRTNYYLGLYSQNGVDPSNALRAALTLRSALSREIWEHPNKDPAIRNSGRLLLRPKTVISLDDSDQLNGYIYYADEAKSERSGIRGNVDRMKTLCVPTQKHRSQQTRVILEAILPPLTERNIGVGAVMFGVAMRTAGPANFECWLAPTEYQQENILIDAGARWDDSVEPVPLLASIPHVAAAPLVAPDTSKLFETLVGQKGSHLHDMVDVASRSRYEV